MAYDTESDNTNQISQQRLVEQFFVRGNEYTIQNSEIGFQNWIKHQNNYRQFIQPSEVCSMANAQ